MKKFQLTLVFISLIVSSIIAQDITFRKGVGFSQAFESGTSVYDIRFQYYTRQDFINVKKLGIDQVRLPIYMSNMLDENGNFHDLFFYLLDKYVDMAEEEGINIILTNMSGYDYENDPTLESQFITTWRQMAEHYKNRSELVHYELANEPTLISDEDWGHIQGNIIDTIRAIDTKHTILVTPPMWSSLFGLKKLPHYSDDNLIYVFHFYDPFFFTHQGASHVGLSDFYGVPFPYRADEMPAMPARFAGTWDEIVYNNYSTEATVAHIKALVDSAAAFKNERNVRVWCGEFGADDRYSKPEDRALWYETLRTSLEENDIAWSMHGYTRYWGLFEFGTNKLFDYDLNTSIVEAMGLNSQPQSEFVYTPEISGFDIYTDYLNSDIDAWISTGGSLSHFYSEQAPKEGKFCIQMKDFPLWCMFRFDFQPNKDLSQLVTEGYVLDFWIKGDSPGAKFNMRFLDTDTDDPEDHPWRMVHDIDETLAPWDGEWYHVQIPLADFEEQGSFDGQWFNPEGKFDWSAVDNFQIQSEYEGLEGKTFWFDNIRIVDVNERAKVHITLQVDMRNENISSKGVFMKGNWDGWQTPISLSRNGDTDVFSCTVDCSDLQYGTVMQYKFANGNYWEPVNGECTISEGQYTNRYITVPAADTILEAVCFNSCEACDYKVNVTFQVDMKNENISSKGVSMKGNWDGWQTPISLSRNGDTDVFSCTVDCSDLQYGTVMQYKFANGNYWEPVNGECTISEGQYTNRYITVPAADTILEAVCFNSCSSCNSLSLEEVAMNNIEVFPNPTDGFIEINGLPTNENIKIVIYNLKGQIQKEILTNNQPSIQIDLSSMNAGTYLIKFKGNRVNKTMKILKNDNK